MPELTHCRETVSALPSSPASTMPAMFGTYAAIPSKVRLRAFQSRRLIGETRVRGDAGVCSQSMTSRSGVGERQRTQQDRVDQRKHRAVGADAEREHQYRGGSEDTLAGQRARGVPQVLAKILEHRHEATPPVRRAGQSRGWRIAGRATSQWPRAGASVYSTAPTDCRYLTTEVWPPLRAMLSGVRHSPLPIGPALLGPDARVHVGAAADQQPDDVEVTCAAAP